MVESTKNRQASSEFVFTQRYRVFTQLVQKTAKTPAETPRYAFSHHKPHFPRLRRALE
jgi:hypothetical protein